ncbi:MAG: YdcF family protein [Verrucomicrobiota bacterium]
MSAGEGALLLHRQDGGKLKRERVPSATRVRGWYDLLVATRRRLRPVLLVVGGLVLGWAIAAAVLFVWPPRSNAGHADAAVVLAGGRGPRLAEGLTLVRKGVAPLLVVSDGWSPTWPEANRLCAGRSAPVPVVCFHPDPYSTRGEAEGFARLAARRGWRSVVVVSSRYHLVRAKMLFERCYDGTVSTASSSGSLLNRIVAAPIETVKLGYALLVKRDC